MAQHYKVNALELHTLKDADPGLGHSLSVLSIYIYDVKYVTHLTAHFIPDLLQHILPSVIEMHGKSRDHTVGCYLVAGQSANCDYVNWVTRQCSVAHLSR